jgi:hypothetical protein
MSVSLALEIISVLPFAFTPDFTVIGRVIFSKSQYAVLFSATYWAT